MAANNSILALKITKRCDNPSPYCWINATGNWVNLLPHPLQRICNFTLL